MHAAATEDLVEALVEAGRCAEAIATISEHIARLPLRDRARGLLLRALAGAGRQAEALRAYRAYRTMLVEEVGTEPSPDVRRIEQRVAAGWDGRDDHGRRTSEPVADATAREVPRSLSTARSGPFVGRDDLLADLLDGWRGGRWTGLVVAGEPGIGKTRLLAELAHAMHADGATVAVGRCDEDAVLSYRPGPRWSRSLQAATARAPRSSTPTPATPRSSMPLLALLRARAPLVVVLDDLHWIDTPSLRVLQRVVAADLPGVTVLGRLPLHRRAPARPAGRRARRSAAARPRAPADHPRPRPAGRRSAGRPRRLARVPDAERHALAQVIRTRTAGNALFVRELILHVANRDDAATDLPDGLVELIDRRVSRLGDDTVGVLRVAAVVGQRFPVDVVEDDGAPRSRPPRRRAGTERRRPRRPRAGARRGGRRRRRGRDGVPPRRGARRPARPDVGGPPPASPPRHRHGAGADRVLGHLPTHLAALAHHHDLARSPEASEWYRRAARAATDAFDVGAVQLAERGLELLAGTDPDPALRCDLLIARAMGLRLAGHETLADARMAAEAAIALGDEARIASALQTLSVRSIDRDMSDHIAFLADGLAAPAPTPARRAAGPSPSGCRCAR